MGLIFKSIEGSTKDVANGALEDFRRGIRGKVLDPEAPSYHEARTIWNATIDRRPALIVQCKEAGDVVRCVQFARDNGLLVAVKGGGHHIAGNAICDDGVVIDLSAMRSVRVDPQTTRALVEPGATLAEVDAATAPYGLAVPVGINSTTGIAGLTLGGGFGWITRKYGLTVDSLIAADVVDRGRKDAPRERNRERGSFLGAAGRRRQFWRRHLIRVQAARGGTAGPVRAVVHPLDGAEALLKQYRALLERAPDELSCWAVLRARPAASVSAGRVARPQGAYFRDVLRWRPCRRRARGGRNSRARRADRRCCRAASIHRVAGRVRPAANAGSQKLLEDA